MRVIVADDAVLLRTGLVRILRDDGFDVVAEAGSATELLVHVDALRPDVVIADVRMPPTNRSDGIDAAREIRRRHPGVAVLLLSQYVAAAQALDLFQSNPAGLGYLLKDRVLHIDEFLESVRRVAAGGTAVDPDIVAELVGRAPAPPPLAELSSRELEVLQAMAEGLSNIAIGHRLHLGVRTVEAYTASIFTKLGLHPDAADHRRVKAVLAYLGTARDPGPGAGASAVS